MLPIFHVDFIVKLWWKSKVITDSRAGDRFCKTMGNILLTLGAVWEVEKQVISDANNDWSNEYSAYYGAILLCGPHHLAYWVSTIPVILVS
jgi:hypothetical protein